jgi:hypothetical protein
VIETAGCLHCGKADGHPVCAECAARLHAWHHSGAWQAEARAAAARDADRIASDESVLTSDGHYLVYVIRRADTQELKIGITRFLPGRLAMLQTAHAVPLQVVCAFFANRETEQALHERFAAHRMLGEWFHECEAIAEWIDMFRFPARSSGVYVSRQWKAERAAWSQLGAQSTGIRHD